MRLAYLICILLGCTFWSRPAWDPDLGWHLTGGAYIVNSFREILSAGSFPFLSEVVPYHDFINAFSNSWHNYHWLAQVFFYQLYELGGYELIHFSLGIFSAATLLVLYLTIKPFLIKESWPLASLILIIPAAILMYHVSSVRPQMISLFFLALTNLILIKKYKYEFIYVLLITILLVNIHVYWVFTILLWFLHRCLNNQSKFDSWTNLILLVLAALVSPYGLLGNDYSLEAIFANYILVWEYLNVSPYLKNTIVEFKNSFASISITSLILITAFITIIRSFNKEKLKDIYFLMAVIGLILCFKSAKFNPVFVIFALPYIASTYRNFFYRFSYSNYNLILSCQVLLILGLLFGTYNSFRTLNNVTSDIHRERPIDACSKIANTKSHEESITVLTNFDEGGWCRWAIYKENPKLNAQVTSDGRTQYLPDQHFRKSNVVYNLSEGWEKILRDWNPDFILAPRYTTLAHHIFKYQKDYQKEFADNNFALFSKK